MNADPIHLDALAELVADGSEVDWEAAEAAATDDQRLVVRNLRLLARIAALGPTVSALS